MHLTGKLRLCNAGLSAATTVLLVCPCGTLAGVNRITYGVGGAVMFQFQRRCRFSSRSSYPCFFCRFNYYTQHCLPRSLCGTTANACVGKRGCLWRVASRPRPKIPSRLHQGKHRVPRLVSCTWTMCVFLGWVLSILSIAVAPGRFKSDRIARDQELCFPQHPWSFSKCEAAAYRK